jgi:NAD+ diphosphatase
VPFRPELGPWPHLGYTTSRIERAAQHRGENAALAKFAADARAGFYLIGDELVLMKKSSEAFDPLFSSDEARGFGNARETVFLGLMDGAPRFGINLEPASVEPLKARNDLKITDIRSIAVHGLVDADHLPPLAEA